MTMQDDSHAPAGRVAASRRVPALRSLATGMLAAAGFAIAAPQARACDACNAAFADQLQNSRAGSLIADDLLAAMENQRGLPLAGLGSPTFAAAGSAPVIAAPALVPPHPGAHVMGAPAASASAPYGEVPQAWNSDPFIEIIRRDYGLPVPPTSYVPQDTAPDKSFTIELSEGKAYVGNGVMYDGFLTNGTIPGPLFIMDEGDVVEFTVVNKGTIPHGASIHAANTQTSKYLGKINPGASGTVVFRATQPGVYLYHCAPGGHAIPMHVMFGQYGMMVVRPKKQTYRMEEIMGRAPDREIYLVQHELYATGRDAVEGRPLYSMFNGKLFRYVEDPIKVRPGDFVRIYFLNVGPNQISTFHIVGILWDYVYWQGHPEAAWPAGQSVLAGPTDSWVIDFRIPPDEGAYTMLNHAVGSASRGAIGLLVAERDAEAPRVTRPEGLSSTPEQLAELEAKATRTISPFKATAYDLATPTRYAPGTKEVTVSIIGNSFSPKVIEIEPGTTVRWVNEDVFTLMAGEFAGIHNAQSVGDYEDPFNLPLLAHGESGAHTFELEGRYDYICTPHPYMEGRIFVKKPSIDLAQLAGSSGFLDAGWLVPLAAGAFVVALISLYLAVSRRKAA